MVLLLPVLLLVSMAPVAPTLKCLPFLWGNLEEHTRLYQSIVCQSEIFLMPTSTAAS